MVDINGNEVATYDYTPVGSDSTDRQLTAIGRENPFRFSSEYHDDETGLVYYNFRYYDPKFGRWTKRDPIGEKGGYNLYGMVGNDAIGRLDYLGMFYWNKNNNTETSPEYKLANQLVLHYLFGRGEMFTKGGDVVKNQPMVKQPIAIILQRHAMNIFKTNNSVKQGNIYWRMVDTGPIMTNTVFWMRKTLNGATDFSISGNYRKEGCTIYYDLKYIFIDKADMHPNKYALDFAVKTFNYINPFWYLNISTPYLINIDWHEKTKITKMFPGLKTEGWPFE
jgi:RHS repeat-associated protein